MLDTKIEVHDEIDKQAGILRYLSEVEDRPGLSELLLEISKSISIIKYSGCLEVDKGVKDGKEDLK